MLNEGFTRLKLSDQVIVKPFLEKAQINHSLSTFAALLMWDTYEHYWWKVEDDQLLLIASPEKPFLPLPPRGWGDRKKAIRQCQKLIGWLGTNALKIDCVDKFERDDLDCINAYESYHDYIYETQSIIELKGKKYSSRRGSRNSFLKHNSEVRCLPYDDSQYNCCRDLLLKWQQQSDPNCTLNIERKRSVEYSCVSRILTEVDSLDLVGMTVYVDDKLIGFTFGEMLDAETCSVLIEKTDRTYKGSAEFIWSEFLRRYWNHTRWCNAGDDNGVPSLEWTKNSYHPTSMLTKWKVVCSV